MFSRHAIWQRVSRARSVIATQRDVLFQSIRPCHGRRPNGCEQVFFKLNTAAWARCVIGSLALVDHMVTRVENANFPKQEIVQPGSQMLQSNLPKRWNARALTLQ